MQVLVKTRALNSLSDWTRGVMRDHKLTQEKLAHLMGLSRSAVAAKLFTGMTYNDVEKIADILKIKKPDLATATLHTLKEEIRKLSGTKEAADYGMEVKNVE